MTKKRGCPWCGCLEIKLDKDYEVFQAYCTSCGARGPEDWDKDRAMELFVGVKWKERLTNDN